MIIKLLIQSLGRKNMNELIQVGENTFYLSGPFHVGVYVLQDTDGFNKDDICAGDVCLIDSGVDKVVARVLDKILQEKNYRVKYIINTHYHADHCGGNAYFKEKYNCKIYSTKPNVALISNFDICPAIIWGASPIKEILNNYFYATSTNAENIEDVELPEGLSYVELTGHAMSMLCVRTKDDILFVGDAVVSKETIDKHPIVYEYEIGSYLDSLDVLKNIKASLYIPYHAQPVKNIKNLIKVNRQNVLDNIETIKRICGEPRHIDEIISMFFNERGLKLSLYKYAVEGGIMRTYVTYLYNNGELTAENIGNYIKWRTV